MISTPIVGDTTIIAGELNKMLMPTLFHLSKKKQFAISNYLTAFSTFQNINKFSTDTCQFPAITFPHQIAPQLKSILSNEDDSEMVKSATNNSSNLINAVNLLMTTQVDIQNNRVYLDSLLIHLNVYQQCLNSQRSQKLDIQRLKTLQRQEVLRAGNQVKALLQRAYRRTMNNNQTTPCI